MPGVDPQSSYRQVSDESRWLRVQPKPVDIDQTDTAVDRGIVGSPEFETLPAKLDERFRIRPVVRVGLKQTRRSTCRSRSETVALDQRHPAEPSPLTSHCRADPNNPSAHDEHVRAAIIGVIAPLEMPAIRLVELVPPRGSRKS